MAKALCVDLRRRVIDAIIEAMSCRRAGERFGVSASSAIRWCQQYRTTGTVDPRTQGGDRRSGRIEAQADIILAVVAETPDITLAEMRESLGNRGMRAGIGTLWRFLDRRNITRKKRPPMPPSKVALTSMPTLAS